MAKAFISFLGTNDYTECKYRLGNQIGYPVKYVQEDIVHRFCGDWNSDDEIRIFTTDDARTMNWDDDGHVDWKTNAVIPNTGLGRRLEQMGLCATIRRHDIPVGNSEAEIWDSFQIVFNTLKEGDEIIFDITHGFRSIPMLFMTLIGYARMLKGITVSGIYYGAFEVLGMAHEVKQMAMEDRVAPIFDLTSFEQLIEWTEATQSFVKNGRAEDLQSLAQKRFGPILKITRGQDEVARLTRDIVNGINRICQNLMTNRGAEIILHDYDWIRKKMSQLKTDDIFIKPLAPLMSVIESKIDGFVKDDIHNGFKAVDWCIEHGLYQQAVTMMQENLVTYVLAEEGLDWGVQKNRDAVSAAFIFTERKDKAPGTKKDDVALIEKLMQNPVVQAFSKEQEAVRFVRNDINHGGYLTEISNKSRESKDIISKIELFYHALKKQLCKA